MAKTTLQTRKKNEADYVTFTENILVKLTENADIFVQPEPSVADLRLALDDFKRARADAAYGDKRLVLIKNHLLALLKAMLYELSLYVEKISKGDPALILAAGFVPRKPSAPVGEAPKPQGLRADIDIRAIGVMKLRVNCWKSALMYQFEYRKKDSNAEWTTVLSSRSRVVLQGLESLQEYEFRVAYLGRNEMIAYSDVLVAPVF